MTDADELKALRAEVGPLRECKRVLEAHIDGYVWSWKQERAAALAACKPPYKSLLDDKDFQKLLNEPDGISSPAMRATVAVLNAVIERLRNEGNGSEAAIRELLGKEYDQW